MRNWNDEICGLLLRNTGLKISNWTEVLEKKFEFTGANGYQVGGRITTVESEPERFFRIWGEGEVYVEWTLDGNCQAYAYKFAGRPGTFAYAA